MIAVAIIALLTIIPVTALISQHLIKMRKLQLDQQPPAVRPDELEIVAEAIARLKHENDQLREQVQRMEQRIDQLERRLPPA
jgi:ubiquinone biosynthesis protein UbiJ